MKEIYRKIRETYGNIIKKRLKIILEFLLTQNSSFCRIFFDNISITFCLSSHKSHRFPIRTNVLGLYRVL